MEGARRRQAILGLAAIVATLIAAGPARAADGDPYVRSCFASVTTPGCDKQNDLASPYRVAASPDGRQLYEIDSLGVLRILDRDPGDGALTRRTGVGNCFGSAGCTPVAHSLQEPDDVALSHDGRTLLVSAAGSLLAFARDPDTGSLAYAGCAGVANDCTQIQGSPSGVGFSSDDRFIYARTQGGLDALRSDLTQVACSTDSSTNGCVDVTALNGGGTQIGVSQGVVAVPFFTANPSPNGPVPAGGVAVFDRHVDGTLTQRTGTSGGCVSVDGKIAGVAHQCVSGGTSLTSPAQVTISPDARFVYVGSGASVTAVPLTQDGALQAPAGATSLRTVISLLATSQALVVSTYGGVVKFFSPGAPVQLPGTAGCMTADGSGGTCQTLPGLGGSDSDRAFVTGDPTGLSVYVTAEERGMLASIVRDYRPVCRAVSAAVPFGAATPIPLDCSDPNGDPLTYAIASGPAKGRLGGVAQGHVVYTPAAGFSGPDQFSYTATARGLTSAVATVAMSVAGPPLAAPVDNDHDGFSAAQDCNDGDASIHRGAREIRGNKVDENCDGVVEPFPSLASPVGTRWTLHGTRFELLQLSISQLPQGWKAQIRCAGRHCPFKARTLRGRAKKGVASVLASLKPAQRRFRAGQTLEVWVTAPGYNTKVARLALRKGRIPTTQSLCAAPGAKKPKRACS